MAKRKANTKKITKIVILITVIAITVIGSLVVLKTFTNKQTPKETVKVIDTVKDYKLNENETDYYKSLFNDLKEVLDTDTIDEEKYARLISQLFLSDFYTLHNKINKNDVGGTQFVYKNFRGDFENLARDSVYHEVENNVYGDRKQELPIVYSVDIIEVKQDNYEYLDQNDEEAYYINLVIKYEKDLGYQENIDLIIIHNGDKLEIAEMSK